MKKAMERVFCIISVFIGLLNVTVISFAKVDHEKAFFDVTIKASFEGRGFLAISKSSVTMYVDSYKLCNIKCGEEYSGIVKLKEGTHVVRVFVTNDNCVSKTFEVKKDSDLNCALKAQNLDITFEGFQLKDGCDEAISSAYKSEMIDVYNFTAVYQKAEVHAIRGSFKEYAFLDLVNEIEVSVTDYGAGHHKPRASVERIEVDADGKIHHFFYFEGKLNKTSTYGMIKHGSSYDYYVRYDKNGIKTDQFTIDTINDIQPLLLKKSGFYEQFPTPSSFLSSDKLYPVYGNG